MIRYVYAFPRRLEPLLVCDRCGTDIQHASEASVVLDTGTPGTLEGDGDVKLAHNRSCLAAMQEELVENCNFTLPARDFFAMLAKLE